MRIVKDLKFGANSMCFMHSLYYLRLKNDKTIKPLEMRSSFLRHLSTVALVKHLV